MPIHVGDGADRGQGGDDVAELVLDGKPSVAARNVPQEDQDMRRMTIRVPMLEKYGYNDGLDVDCSGCTVVKEGTRRYTHTDE